MQHAQHLRIGKPARAKPCGNALCGRRGSPDLRIMKDTRCQPRCCRRAWPPAAKTANNNENNNNNNNNNNSNNNECRGVCVCVRRCC
jgi:hypothetical protein